MTATEIRLPENFRSSNEIAEECMERGERYREIKNTPETRRGDTWEADRRRSAQELLEANQELDGALRMERAAFESAMYHVAIEEAARQANLTDEQRRAEQIRGPQAAFVPVSTEVRSWGEQFTTDKGAADRSFRTGDYEVEIRNLLTGSNLGTSGSNLFAPVGSPLYTPQTNQRRRLFVRDLVSVQQTGLQSVPYIRELSAATNETGATAVSEASAKPEVTMQFESADAPIRKIAAWIQATEEALEDAPTLRGYIDTRLEYMLRLREEVQVIGVGNAGGGIAPNIKGITDFSTIQTASTQEFYDVIGTSIGKIENVDGDPDGVVVNPLDFWAAVTDRHAQVYDNPNFTGSAPFGMPMPTVWGLPAVRSRSMAQGKCLVGSWQLGATLFEREGVTLRTTDSHASLFISNTWVILAEERVGLAVHRPDFFVLATITAPS